MSAIGRVNVNGEFDSKATFFEPCHPSFQTSCTAFANEHDFDSDKVEEVRKMNPAVAGQLEKQIQKLSHSYSQSFVLTHGDLNARNILVKLVMQGSPTIPVWQISSILDWERSGFVPEYMEYTLARVS